jgi:uncharacterized protein YndB with AHSA1/START domain
VSEHKPVFVYVTYIESTLEKVWQALTDGDFTQQYWGGLRISSDWQVGSQVQHVRPGGGIGWLGEVLRCEPPNVLSYTFSMQMNEGYRADAPSRVTYELREADGVVRLTLTHEHAGPSATYENTRHGWPAIMSSLKSLVETGKPLPFKRLGFGPGDSRFDQTKSEVKP